MKDMNPEEEQFLNEPWMRDEEVPKLSRSVKGKLDRQLFQPASSRTWMMAAAAVLVLALLGFLLFRPKSMQTNPHEYARTPEHKMVPVADSNLVSAADTAHFVFRVKKGGLAQHLAETKNTKHIPQVPPQPVPQRPIAVISVALADHPGILETCPEIF